jgi:[ribosomal protein S18]-alanine N-acetyltransferase
MLNLVENLEPEICYMRTENISQILEIQTESKISPWSEKGYLDELKNKNSKCLVAKFGKETVGFAIMRLIITDKTAEILNIAIRLNFQRKNFAQTLLNEIYKLSIYNNLERIILEVRVTNEAAIKFYKKNSFKITQIQWKMPYKWKKGLTLQEST